MMKNYLTFDFGESFFRDQEVIDLVLDKMPVSISIGLWTTVLVYLISIPFGNKKRLYVMAVNFDYNLKYCYYYWLCYS